MLLAAKSLHISRFVQISSYPHPFLTICGLPVLTSKKRHISSSSEPVQNAVIRSVVNCKSISPFSVIVTSVTVSSVSKCRIRSNFLSNTQESCTPKSTAPLDGDAFLYKILASSQASAFHSNSERAKQMECIRSHFTLISAAVFSPKQFSKSKIDQFAASYNISQFLSHQRSPKVILYLFNLHKDISHLSCIFKPKTMAKLKFRRPLFRCTNIFIRNLE